MLQDWREKLAKNTQSPVRQHRGCYTGLCEIFYRQDTTLPKPFSTASETLAIAIPFYR